MWGYTFFMNLFNFLRDRLFKNPLKVSDVKKQVNELKADALKEGMPQLINRLYFTDIHYYPSWITISDSRRYVPAMVTSSQGGIKDGKEEVQVSINGHEYTFLHSQPKLNIGDTSYLLELFHGEERVMALRGHLHYISSIESYIKGEWIEEFKKLEEEVVKHEQLEQETEDPNEIRELKKNFGIKE